MSRLFKRASLTDFKFHFTPSWRMSVAAVLAFLLLARLGFWQLDRAHEKEQMVAAEQVQTGLPPIQWRAGAELPKQYQSVQVEGTFLPALLWLDNQHHQHQFGYHAISPLLLEDGGVVLVDFGWIAGDLSRRVLPVVSTPSGKQRVVGSAYYPSLHWVLGPVLEKRAQDVVVIERVDFKEISRFLQKSVYPYMIRLDPAEPYGYVREWPVVAMNPQRHYGYALQWFAMALVVVILFVSLNLKKKS